VQLVDRTLGDVTDTLATLARPGPSPGRRTTLDAGLQRAAERATATRPDSALVVLQPSTGGILAIANSPAGGTDLALLGRLAPGSTMKVITTAALLAAGLSPASTAPCPDTVTVNGKTFHNAEGVVNGTLSLTADFARSCNTAFIGLRDRLSDGALTDQATGVFGLVDWDIGLGVPVAYGSVPIPVDPVTKAANMIGQGTVAMSPLAMASVAATVATGQFTQPSLLPGSPRARAARSLPTAIAAALRDMMRQVVTAGTARHALGDLPGGIHAKTGTAQAPGGDNGWLVGYRGDLAFGCLVEGGGHGADSCGPLVREFLRATG
jgi:cell division protein FtsI/penicillin-binding protein 2